MFIMLNYSRFTIFEFLFKGTKCIFMTQGLRDFLKIINLEPAEFTSVEFHGYLVQSLAIKEL
jgi:hypothetical protein